MALRRRGTEDAYGRPLQEAAQEPENDKKKASAMTQAIQSMDLYTRVDDEFVEATSGGGRASVLGLLLVVVLGISQVLHWAFPPEHQHVVVDTSLGNKLQINMNISFHALGCDEVHLDAMDVAGDNQIDIEHDMWKQRLTGAGFPIGEPFTEEPGRLEKIPPLPEDYCGSCYGADGPAPLTTGPTAGRSCCNTCAQLVEAYRRRGWNIRDIKQTSEQCQRERIGPLADVKPGEGCSIAGSMLVNQVAGNFHFAIGDSVLRDGRHIHQFSPQEAPEWNCSHTIRELSFGRYYPGMVNPLDSSMGIASAEDGTGLFQYFIKVVPTLYRAKPPRPGEDSLSKLELAAEGPQPETKMGKRRAKARRRRKDVRTNVYTYSAQFTPYDPDHAKHWREEHGLDDPAHRHYGPFGSHGAPAAGSVRRKEAKQAGMVLPGVFFIYDISAFMVQVQREKVPFSHLLTQLLAIAGGVFSLANLLDSAAYYIGRRVEGAFLG